MHMSHYSYPFSQENVCAIQTKTLNCYILNKILNMGYIALSDIPIVVY